MDQVHERAVGRFARVVRDNKDRIVGYAEHQSQDFQFTYRAYKAAAYWNSPLRKFRKLRRLLKTWWYGW